MRRRVVALVGLVLAVGLTIPALEHLSARDQIYTVPQIVAGLSGNPYAWIGRTVLVRGTAGELVPPCPSGSWCPTLLFAGDRPTPGQILLLEPGPASPLLAPLRRVPLVGRVIPAAQRLRWYAPATYRILFQAVPGTTCDSLPCVNALLVDAAQ